MNDPECVKSPTKSEPQRDMMVCRESARGILGSRIRRSEKRHQGLEVLMKVIPWNMLSAEDEEVLWSYFASE